MRKVLASLASRGLLTGSGRHRVVRATGEVVARFPSLETISMAAQIEKRFMAWIALDDPPPGTMISELELARTFGVATTGIREFLFRFQRFGLVDKRPSGGWVFKGFTTSFALELFEIREMFELRSAMTFAALPDGSATMAAARGTAHRSTSSCKKKSTSAFATSPISTAASTA